MPVISLTDSASEEKLQFAQFLHDTVNSNLAILKMQLSHMFKHTKSKEQRQELKSMSDLVDEIITSIRAASSEVKKECRTSSLYSAVKKCAIQFERRTGIRTLFLSSGDDTHIPDKVSVAIMAILAEALANVVRHARASEVHIEIAHESDFLKLSVRDNGSGSWQHHPGNRKGFGLFSMRQRANNCGGTVSVSTAGRHGFQVLVLLPVTKSEMA